MSDGVCFRSQTGSLGEHAVKMKATHPRRLRQNLQARRLFRCFDGAAGCGYCRRVLLSPSRSVGLASFARPKTSSLGLFAGSVKLDILAA